MNKAQLQKNVGARVRLRPPATTALGAHDDDWTVRRVSDETIELVNERTTHVATLGLDAVKSYTSDPRRDADGVKYGFLSLTVAVKLLGDGKTDMEPLSFGRGDAPSPALNPLVVIDGGRRRLFSWRGRDPVHRLIEEQPAQLMDFFVPLCDALRIETGREPEFCSPDRLNGDVVYEVSPDGQARWPLLGGNGGRAGQAILVLTTRGA